MAHRPSSPLASAATMGIRGGLLAAALLLAGPAVAQQRPAARPAPAPASAAEPQSTTATFADWTLRCQRPEGRPQVCELSQAVLSDGRPVAQIGIGRPAGGGPMRLAFLVVPNVVVETPPRLLGPTGSAVLAELGWRRCVPNGCLADTALPEALLGRLSAQTENGRLIFLDAGGREVTVPFSPRGLDQALAALERG